MSCALCRDAAPFCDWCLARVVGVHREQIQAYGRYWGRSASLQRALPSWERPGDRVLALRMVRSFQLVDPRASEALAQVWIESVVQQIHARIARRARDLAAARAPAARAPAEEWLMTRYGQPYTRARAPGAVGYLVRRRVAARWHEVSTSAGRPLVLPLDITREAFKQSVGPGAYKLIPVTEDGGRVPVQPPKSVTIL